ncbi:UDP pyrophosphate phosphatase [Marinobacter sp.]|uniref:UDP pyrophosphate phosphatase n=1 Tax=Marinobacter sp. TaxID=50741 RepID=UPI0034A5755C
MIGGFNPNSSVAFQSGNNTPVRERSDVARAPASGPEKNADGVRRDLADGRPGNPPPRQLDTESLDRRVEARRAAEDARLERFRADELPLSTSRALATFTDIAARGDSGENGLAGIDILA